jgi:hypothetical protein
LKRDFLAAATGVPASSFKAVVTEISYCVPFSKGWAGTKENIVPPWDTLHRLIYLTCATGDSFGKSDDFLSEYSSL